MGNSTSPSSEARAGRSPLYPVVPATKASTMATVLCLIHRLIPDLPNWFSIRRSGHLISDRCCEFGLPL